MKHTFKFIYPERPQLLTLDSPIFDILSDSGTWIAEKKYNGSHIQIHLNLKTTTSGKGKNRTKTQQLVSMFYTREGSHYTASDFRDYFLNYFSARTDLFAEMPLILDAEARHHKVQGVSLKLMVYDVFMVKGHLLKTSFKDRRKFLEKHFPIDGTPAGTPIQYDKNFRTIFDEVTKDPEIEGLVLKQLNSHLALSTVSAADSTWMYKVRKANNSYPY